MTSPFFKSLKQKEIVRALRKLARYETLLKNLAGNANPGMCLCYQLCLINVSVDVFWDCTCVRILWIWFK